MLRIGSSGCIVLMPFLQERALYEPTMQQVDDVAGGMTLAGSIAMTLAIGWTGGVVGFAAGSMVPGVGNAVGAVAGGAVGILAGIGLALADAT